MPRQTPKTDARKISSGLVTSLHLSGDAEADQLLSEIPLALLIGMVLDQQVPLERAFTSPRDLRQRLGGKLGRGGDRGHGSGEAGGRLHRNGPRCTASLPPTPSVCSNSAR